MILTVKAQVLVSIGVFCREMYHCNEKCKVLIAAAGPNGHIRCRDNCQVCQPETGTLVGCDFNRIEVSLFRLPYNGEVKADDAVSMPYLLWHGECQGRVTEFVLDLSRTSSKGGVKNHPMYS